MHGYELMVKSSWLFDVHTLSFYVAERKANVIHLNLVLVLTLVFVLCLKLAQKIFSLSVTDLSKQLTSHKEVRVS